MSLIQPNFGNLLMQFNFKALLKHFEKGLDPHFRQLYHIIEHSAFIDDK